MNNYELYEYIEWVANRDGRGNAISPEEYAMLLPILSTKHYENLLDEFEKDSSSTQSLNRFKVIRGLNGTNAFQVNPDGYVVMPDDFGKLISAYSMLPIRGLNDRRKVEILTHAQYSERMSSDVEYPTTVYPICTEKFGYIIVAPFFQELGCSYLRKPIAPTFEYTVDVDGVITYDTNSIELDWDDYDKIRIAGYFLEEMGVNMRDKDLYQMAKIMKEEQK